MFREQARIGAGEKLGDGSGTSSTSAQDGGSTSSPIGERRGAPIARPIRCRASCSASESPTAQASTSTRAPFPGLRESAAVPRLGAELVVRVSADERRRLLAPRCRRGKQRDKRMQQGLRKPLRWGPRLRPRVWVPKNALVVTPTPVSCRRRQCAGRGPRLARRAPASGFNPSDGFSRTPCPESSR